MPKVRPTGPTISLFPFMSILACLVGTIVVLICILSMVQAQFMGGRPREEVAWAMDYVAAQEKIQATEADLAQLKKLVERDASKKSEIDGKSQELDQRLLKLRRDLATVQSADKTSREKQKELELAITQLEALAQERPEITKEIAKLKKELEAKKIAVAAPPKVVVQPGGSSTAGSGALYFVDAASGAITLYKSKTETARITAGSIGADAEYDQFLERIAAQRGATLVFLIRADGWWSYVRAAGWAEDRFKIKTAKLPIPSQGAIDLGPFESRMAK